MSGNMFDRRRVTRTIMQRGKRKGMWEQEMRDARVQMNNLVDICGVFTQNRRMAGRIGRSLIDSCKAVVVPIRFLYPLPISYKPVVEKLMLQHVGFLKKVIEINPTLKPIFLYPDLEQNDHCLNHRNGISDAVYARTVHDIRFIVENHAEQEGWEAIPQQKFLPKIRLIKAQLLTQLETTKNYASKIHLHICNRRDTCRVSDYEQGKKCAMLIAAEFMALGGGAYDRNMMICDHASSYLRWYMQTKAAVLHNPISLT